MATSVTIPVERIRRAQKAFQYGPISAIEQSRMTEENKSLSEVRFDAFYRMSEAEEESAKRKSLSHKQWKLRELYRLYFEEEFLTYKDDLFVKRGISVSYAGLTLKERMNMFPYCASEALTKWSEALEVVDLIDSLRKTLPAPCQTEYYVLTYTLQAME